MHIKKNHSYNDQSNIPLLDNDGNPRFMLPYEINVLCEHYFKDKTVSRFVEYAPNNFLVCLVKDDHINFLVRKLDSSSNGVLKRVIKPGGKSCCFELCLIPNFSMEERPFIFMRDDKLLFLICVREGYQKVLVIGSAKYESKQSYKTMECIADPDGSSDFMLAVLTHMNDATSRVVHYKFDHSF